MRARLRGWGGGDGGGGDETDGCGEGGEGCGGGERREGRRRRRAWRQWRVRQRRRGWRHRAAAGQRAQCLPHAASKPTPLTRDEVSDCSVWMRVGRGASPGLTLVHIAGQAVRQAALMQCRGSAIAGTSRRAALRPRAPACTGRATWDARPAARGGGGRRAGGGGGRGAAADQRAWTARTSSGAARRCRVLPLTALR